MDHIAAFTGFDETAGWHLGMRPVYRVWQFWHALTAFPDAGDLVMASEVLSPALMELFLRLQPSEQEHALGIFRRLTASQEKNPDLLAAALLHDVGKSRYPLHLEERIVIVLAKKLFPKRVKVWGIAQPYGWRRPFVVAEQHPAWGAEMAEAAGATPGVVRLIRRHHEQALDSTDPGELELLKKLQDLDNQR